MTPRRPDLEPVAEVVDPDRARSREQQVAAAALAARARLTVEALAAGMPVRSARRWPLYLAMKAKQRQQPIELWEAVVQCQEARRAA